MAAAKKSFGAFLYRETSPASATFTKIGGLTNVPMPRISTDVTETTDMDAPGAFRTRIPTLNTLEPATYEINYDSADATHEQIVADQIAQTPRLYKVIAADTGLADWAFNAYVTAFEVTGTRDGLHTATLTLTPTGEVTRT